MTVIWSTPAADRRRSGANGLAYHNRWPVAGLRRSYRRLRELGASPYIAREVLWDAAWRAALPGSTPTFVDSDECCSVAVPS